MNENIQIETIRKITNILEGLENKNILLRRIEHEFDPTDLTDLGNTSRFHVGIEKLLERKQQIIDNEFDEDDFTELIIEVRVLQFCVRLESLKYIFSRMLDASKLKYDKEKIILDLKEITLGNLIKRINDGIFSIKGVSDKERKELEGFRNDTQELFFTTFRNAIIHRNFKVMGGELSYGKPQKHITSEVFKNMNLTLNALEEIIWEKYNDLDQP